MDLAASTCFYITSTGQNICKFITCDDIKKVGEGLHNVNAKSYTYIKYAIKNILM